jgi:hypothetical protein
MTRNRQLALGVGIGLFGALAVLTARYVAVVSRVKSKVNCSARKQQHQMDPGLKSLIEANMCAHLIAAKLKRSVPAIRYRANILNILMKRVRLGLKAKK